MKTGYPEQHGNTHHLRQTVDNKTIGQQLFSGTTGAPVVQSPILPISRNENTSCSFKPSLIPNDGSICHGLARQMN
jgi:hypothetical protein